jgi:transposase
MEIKKRKKYSKEFKEDVVNILKTGDKRVSVLSRELDIAEGIIYRWYKKSEGKNEKVTEKVGDQDKEIRELRKKLAETEEERDILKKAVSIFSKQGKSK